MVNLDAILFKEFKCVASFKLKTSSQEEIQIYMLQNLNQNWKME